MTRPTLMLLLTLASSTIVYGQQTDQPLSIGEPAPEIGFDKLLQAPEGAKAKLADLKGKVVVLDFWGPQSRPCAGAFSHLNELADKFRSKPVQFIAIASCDEATAKKFTEITPIAGWIGIDTKLWMFCAYSASPVPHTVVVDKQGRIAAITQPENLTEAAIESLLADKSIQLPLKVGKSVRPLSQPDARKDEPEPLVQITIAPSDSPPSAFRYHIDHGGRRLTAEAAPLPFLVAAAFQAGYGRVAWMLEPSNDRYRVSVIVPKGKERSLYPLFQEAVTKTFDLKPTWRNAKMPCLILRRNEDAPLALTEAGAADHTTLKKHKPNSSKGATFQSEGLFTGSGISMAALASSLESLCGVPVVNETEIDGLYDVRIWYTVGDMTSLRKSVEALGLLLDEDKRTIKVLVVEREDLDL